MDRNTAKIIHEEVAAALKIIGARHKLNVKTGTFRFDTDGFKVGVEGKHLIATTAGTSITAQGVTYAKMHGFDPLRTNLKGYKIVDYNTRAKRTPWIVEDRDGKRWRLSSESAEYYFKVSSADSRALAASSMADDIMSKTTPPTKTGSYAGQF